MLTKILASVCRFCPACILKRRLPGSAYARIMTKVERGCPFCRAYDTMTVGAGHTHD
jgi:hypothetical protein